MSPVKRSTLLAALMALLLAVIALFGVSDLINSLEMRSLALRQRLYSLPPKDRSRISPVNIIGFDYKTFGSDDFNRLFGNRVAGGIISRAVPAYVVRFFNRTQTKAVLFDLSFNGGTHHQDLTGDLALVNSLTHTRNVSSALYFEYQADSSHAFRAQPAKTQQALLKQTVTVQGIEQFPLLLAFRYAGLVPPYDTLLESSPMRFYAAQGPFSNTDNRIGLGSSANEHQRWAPFAIYGDHVYPSLALGAALNGQQSLTLNQSGLLSWPGGKVHLGADGAPLIKWHGHGVDAARPVYPEFSLWDIVRSEMVLECRENPAQSSCHQIHLPNKPPLQPEQFKDKYILLGFTMPDAMDTHGTIYGIRYSGIYILANVLDNLLADEFVIPAPLWLNVLFALILPGLLLLAIWRFNRIWISLLAGLSLALGYFLLSYWAYGQLNLWLNTVYPLLGLVCAFIILYAFRYYQEHQKRQQLRFAFGKYVSPGIMQWIEQHPEKITLGGERREMSFLFCDIRGFTTFSDQHPPEEVQALLSQYFSVMNTIILNQYQGTINKLIGDAIMAYWGFPQEESDHAYLAVSAALAMKQALIDWRQTGDHIPFHIGIGINTGDAMIGNVGSEDFMDFTVIGDAVNVASRLESANKEFGTQIIISSATYARVQGRIRARNLGLTTIRGKEEPIELFEPLELL